MCYIKFGKWKLKLEIGKTRCKVKGLKQIRKYVQELMKCLVEYI